MNVTIHLQQRKAKSAHISRDLLFYILYVGVFWRKIVTTCTMVAARVGAIFDTKP